MVDKLLRNQAIFSLYWSLNSDQRFILFYISVRREWINVLCICCENCCENKDIVAEMSNLSFLEFQYKLSRNRLLRKPSRLFSSRDRKNSASSSPTFQPNLSEMRQVFNKFDTNRDGKISQQEYRATLRALGQDKTVGDVPKIFQVVDLDGDGFIDFKEFVEAQKKGGIKTADIQSAFCAFDVNGDGKITAEELMDVLRRLGERCSLEDCRRMVRGVDSDGDGMVDMDEFVTMMTKTMLLG
ncbi:calmodulin-like protein 30 [Euphorbia lathyris]|uniref:calmodulin-like protein 30 n=1 Tax=Euphorbia lathyris TaxID=212925 RepID=UPI00331367BC